MSAVAGRLSTGTTKEGAARIPGVSCTAGSVLRMIWNRIGGERSIPSAPGYSFLETENMKRPNAPGPHRPKPLLNRAIFAATMIILSLNWSTASAQINYEVTNATNSYWKLYINYIDDQNQGQVYQVTIGAGLNAVELNDGVEMTQVTIKTTGGTQIATANEFYYHSTDCSGWPGGSGYEDVGPSLAIGFCIQWGNENATYGACQINYKY